MVTKHRVAKLEKHIKPLPRGPWCKYRIVDVPDGLTRAEQEAFMDNCPPFEDDDGERENRGPGIVHLITYFIVGVPTDSPARSPMSSSGADQ